MCTVCGCGSGEARIEGKPSLLAMTPRSALPEGAEFIALDALPAAPASQEHGADTALSVATHVHGDGCLRFGLGGGTTPGTRLLQVEQDLLAGNDALAARNRRHFRAHDILALNLMSSPGAGKTTLLVRTLQALYGQLPLAVIEGDQETRADAERIRATGVPAIQVNTGKGCHLDAGMVGEAIDHLPAVDRGVLFIENVGNLVCPAAFDLGEAVKVVLASVTEGEDKPLKYPQMFAVADLVLVSKCDLLPHLDFDVEALIANARRIRPQVQILCVDSRSAEGLAPWLAWLRERRAPSHD